MAVAHLASDDGLRVVRRYGIALLVFCCAAFLQISLQPWLNGDAPFILAMPAVVVSAWIGGLGPGALTAILGGFLGNWSMVVDSPESPSFSGRMVAMALYIFGSILSLSVIELKRQADAQAVQAAEDRAAAERRWAVTLRSLGDGVVAVDKEGHVSFLNPVAEALTGWTLDEAIGRPCEEVLNLVEESSGRSATHPIRAALQSGHIEGLDDTVQLVSKDGAIRNIDDKAAPIHTAEGGLIGAVMVFRDVTEQRRVELGVKRLAMMLDLAHESIIVHDLDHRITFWNKASETLYGFTKEDAIGKCAYDLVNTQVDGGADAIIASVLSLGYWEGRLKQISSDGAVIDVQSRSALQRDEHGNPTAVLIINRDITEELSRAGEIQRLNTDLAVRISELETLLEVLPVGIGITADGDPRNIRPNKALSELLGLEPQANVSLATEASIRPHYSVLRNGQQVPVTDLPIQAASNGIDIRDQQLVVVRPNGEQRDVLAYASPIRDRDGRLRGGVGAFIDITLRYRAQTALLAERNFISTVLDTVGAVVLVIDQDGMIVRANSAAETISGFSGKELIRRVFCDLLSSADDKTSFRRCIDALTPTAEPQAFDGIWITKNGRRVLIEWSIALMQGTDPQSALIVATGIDVTEQRKAQNEVSQLYASLRESTDELRAILEVVPVGLVIAEDSQCASLRANPYLRQMFRLPAEGDRSLRKLSTVRPKYTILKDGKPIEDHDLPMAQSASKGETFTNVEMDVAYDDGSISHFLTSSVPLLDDVGRPCGSVTSLLDITTRRQMEQQLIELNHELERRVADRTRELETALQTKDQLIEREKMVQRQLRQVHDAFRESEANYRSLFSSAPHAIAVIDGLTQTFMAVNDAATAQYGFTVDEFQSLTLSDLCPPGENVNLLPSSDRDDEHGMHTAVVWHRRKDGRNIMVEVVSRKIYFAGRPAWLFLANDVTERELAAQELQASLDQIRRLAQHVQSVREEERKDVAREVHDELGQLLSALKMDLLWVISRLERSLDPESAVNRLRGATELVDSTIQTVRRIATQLRPGVLDTLGLVAAMEWQARDFEARTGIPCLFVSAPGDIALPSECSTALFRILQEALTNVMRHAQATRVRISLSAETAGITLSVVDNGVGISEDSLQNTTSLGLVGMKERAMLFGGEVKITRAGRKGTRVDVTIPCPCPALYCGGECIPEGCKMEHSA